MTGGRTISPSLAGSPRALDGGYTRGTRVNEHRSFLSDLLELND
jgi:hypothetical protein